MSAIFSEILGDRRAYEATLAEMAKLGVRRMVVMGDVVGYGPYPNGCMRHDPVLELKLLRDLGA